MTELDEQGRPEPPLAAGEADTLVGFLDFQRATLAWKCSGLDAVGLNARVAGFSMTLGGLLKHLAYVEEHWFSRSLHGQDPRPPWDAVDWKTDPDWEWRTAAEDSPEQLHALWQDAVARSRALTAQALADGGLERPARRGWSDGSAPAVDLVSHDRGVRAAQRSRRLPAGIGGRPHRGVAAERSLARAHHIHSSSV